AGGRPNAQRAWDLRRDKSFPLRRRSIMATRTISERRLAANRANALKSTGPRTAEGKERASKNTLKHGVVASYSHLSDEWDATFNLFLDELREELRPRTNLQRTLFVQIANLTWRLRRLPEAQTKLFAAEREKIESDEREEMPACEVMARRFSDAPKENGFLL